MKIRPVGAELFRGDRQRNRHDEVARRFSQFCEGTKEAQAIIYEDSVCWIHTNTIFEHLALINWLSYNMLLSHRLTVIRRRHKHINGKSMLLEQAYC